MSLLRPSPLPLVTARAAGGLMRPPHRDPALYRVRPGVYVERANWDACEPWDRYLTRVQAVAATWNRPVFSFESAAAIAGLPFFGEPRHIHVLATAGIHSTSKGDVRIHSAARPRRIAHASGLRFTDVGDTALDLARLLPPAHGLAVMDAALRILGTAALERLADRAQELGPAQGSARRSWVLATADARAESPFESISRAVIEWLGYPAPSLQVEFPHAGGVDRVDFFWSAQRVIGEADGYAKYEASDPALARRRFAAEKRREDRLRRKARGFARWEWADVMHPDRLDAILRAAGLRPVRPRNEAMLRTIGLAAR